MATTLLDALAKAAGCIYLSDLLQAKQRAGWTRCVRAIPPEQYPLIQWQEAIRYISGDSTITAESETQAREILCSLSQTSHF